MYLLISILLIIMASAVAWLPMIKDFRATHAEIFNFWFTLIATFVGVFIAIELTNLTEQNKEEENAKKLLIAARVEIDSKIRQVEMNRQDIILAGLTGAGKVYITDNPLRFPNLYKEVVSNESVLKRINADGVQYLNRRVTELQILQEGIDMGKPINDTSLIIAIDQYIQELGFTRNILTVQIDILDDKIKTKQEMDKKYEEAYFDAYPEFKGLNP